jgi:hypothetical protein
MHTKLTLRIDVELIRKAKRYSKKSGRSLSSLVSNYLHLLTESEATKVKEEDLTPWVRSLYGALKGSGVSEEDYKRYLEERNR